MSTSEVRCGRRLKLPVHTLRTTFGMQLRVFSKTSDLRYELLLGPNEVGTVVREDLARSALRGHETAEGEHEVFGGE